MQILFGRPLQQVKLIPSNFFLVSFTILLGDVIVFAVLLDSFLFMQIVLRLSSASFIKAKLRDGSAEFFYRLLLFT